MANECVSSAVVSGAAPGSWVAEGPTTLAFMDADPVSPGHVLIIQKQQLPQLNDLDDLDDHIATQTHCYSDVRLLPAGAFALRHSTLRCEGVHMFYADGASAEQESNMLPCSRAFEVAVSH